MAIDFAALRAEIATDPAALGYPGKSRGQVRDLLNAPDPASPPRWTKAQPLISAPALRRWAAAAGARQPLEAGVTNASAAVASICLAVRDFLMGGGDPLDLADPANQSMIAALVTARVLTADQAASLNALGTVPASRAEALFGAGTVVSLDDIYRVI